jgi:hypothetical protein
MGFDLGVWVFILDRLDTFHLGYNILRCSSVKQPSWICLIRLRVCSIPSRNKQRTVYAE